MEGEKNQLKLCICQIIKDEHDYIEEWIEYHHDLGFNNFYLIEDYCSKSHEELLKKYDYVHLYKFEDVINDHDRELLKNRIFRQCIVYYIFNRLWRKDNDWMAFIDPDEYIELTKEELYNILENSKNEPIITMKWKIMKCDGNIYRPNKGQKYSLLNTYKTYSKIPSRWLDYKQLINCHDDSTINTFKHIPHEFEQPNNYKYNIKLKHFCFKSFEEYVNYIKYRGDMKYGKWNKKIDDWFNINSEYKNIKDSLCKIFKVEPNLRININNKYIE